MKLLVDMNLSPRWVGLLSEAGFEAVHWSSVGEADATDTRIISWAVENNHAVLTYDLDFGAILAASQGVRPSVVQIRANDTSPDVIGTQVVAALRQMKSEIEEGALLTIDAGRTRLTFLPLPRR